MSAARSAAVALAVLLLGADPARAQPAAPDPANLRGESAQTRKRLAEADQKVLGGKAAEAVEELQRILDEAGDDLIAVDAPGRQFRSARWVAHQILAKLPADALKAYQDRIDEPARKLLAAGKQNRDPRPLWQLLDRYFVSRPAEEGLLLLGDLLFERGEFRAAELVWRRLLPDADVPYPNPKTDPAAVRARVVLAAAFQGDPSRAKAELATLAAKHPNAAGPLAGKTGPFADTLRPFVESPPRLPPDARREREWPTFGGGPDRGGVAARMPHYWPSRPTWTALIPPDHTVLASGPIGTSLRPPFGYPVIAGGHAYVADGHGVFAFDLLGGNRSTLFAVPGRNETRNENRTASPDPAFSLTAADGRLYARLGPAAVKPPAAPKGAAAEESVLVCFAPPADRKPDAPPMAELWRLKPPAMGDAKTPGVWEGAPLVANRRLWAAVARFDGGRLAHAVACYDPADPEAAPDRPAWVAEVSDTAASPGGEARTRQELLTLAGRNVVFCTNAGAVVALDAATGRRAWAFRYPRTARRSAEANRSPDPAPAVAAGGRVFVAPADAERVYALDAETGQLLWESGPTEGAQILGVTRDRVVVAVAGPLRGIRGLNAATGSHRHPDGWVQSDGGGLLGYGRGFVTDEVIVWPTRAGLFFLRPDDGFPIRDPLLTLNAGARAGLFGNVVYADGCLVVVTPMEVWGYVSDARRFGGTPKAGIDPDRARFETAVDAAEADLAGGNTAAARVSLLRTARSDLPPRLRAWAAGRLLLLTPAGEAALPGDVRDALRPELLGEWVVAPDGGIVTLEALAARHAGRERPAASPFPSLPQPARKPEKAPDLTADSEIETELKLARGSRPLAPIPGSAEPPRHLFAQAGPRLTAVGLSARRATDHAALETFTHAADIPGGFVAAGPLAVAVYGSATDALWVFRVPDTDPLPDSPGRVAIRTDDPPAVPELSGFLLVGGWLFARLGDRHLMSLDLKERRVGWVLGANGRAGYEPVAFPNARRFAPRFSVVGRTLFAQLSDGRRWLVRADTGRVWDASGSTFAAAVPTEFGDRTSAVPWVTPPVEIDSNRIAIADGPGTVRLLHLLTGRSKWVYDAGGESSLTGEPPQVRAWGDELFVAIRRNHGVDLDRLDPVEGVSAWADPVFLDADRIDFAAADADPLRLFVPVGNKLRAFALKDGKAAWEAELPETNGAGGWVVKAGRRAVVAYPAHAIPAEPLAEVWGRVRRGLRPVPLGWRLPGFAATLYDTWVDRTAPVLLFDPESGKQLKRIDLPARGPWLAAWFDADAAAVMTGDRVCWLR